MERIDRSLFVLDLSEQDANDLRALLDAIIDGDAPTSSGRALLRRVSTQLSEALAEDYDPHGGGLRL